MSLLPLNRQMHSTRMSPQQSSRGSEATSGADAKRPTVHSPIWPESTASGAWSGENWGHRDGADSYLDLHNCFTKLF
ncbi:hypothetical protein RE6C_02568 [Rhodopirellula europaea 6C]|uniref:Uncharacterized protein n=1 Tax=Rhodopirellula europaea 6C TaxID=1263867 RepID=M2B4T3_9BACT|nr:hypothetical protein RE6C_02568 [Rhodopirellula europaea 6C]